MVVNAANTVDLSSIGTQISTKSDDAGVFSEVLQQEINSGTIQNPQDTSSLVQTDGSILDNATDFIKQLLAQITGGNEDSDTVLDILQKLLQQLNSENTDDSNDWLQGLLQVVEQLANQLSVNSEAIIPDTEAVTAASGTENMALSADVMQNFDGQTVAGEQQNSQQNLFGNAQENTITQAENQTMQSEAIPEQTDVSQNIQPTSQQNVQMTTQQSVEMPVGVQTNALRINQTAIAENQQNVQTETAIDNTKAIDTAKAADEIFTKLMDFAKNELGLESANVEISSDPLEMMTSFVRPETPKTSEIDQLIAHITGQTQTKTETQNAVAMPENLTGQVYQPQVEVTEAMPQTETRQIPITAQIADAIMSRLETTENGETTFTMVLNPESLGRIAIKLVSNAGKVSVEIAADTQAAQNLLSQRGDNLAEALKANNVDLEKYQVVYEPQQDSLYRENYNGSSKNPYVRQENNDDENSSDTSFADLLMSM